MKLYRHQSIFTNLKRVIPDGEKSLTPDQKLALCMIHSYTRLEQLKYTQDDAGAVRIEIWESEPQS